MKADAEESFASKVGLDTLGERLNNDDKKGEQKAQEAGQESGQCGEENKEGDES